MRKKLCFKIFTYLILCLILVVQFYPIFWVLTTSLKTQTETQTGSPFAFPQSIYLGNYQRAIEESNLGLYYFNSIVVTLVTIVCIIIFSSTAAFAIQKMRFKFSNTAMTFFLSGITIPIHITLIPLFMIYRNLDILNSYVSLILPQIGFGLPISIYLFTAFYKYVPDSLLEAATIDGASIIKSFVSIYLPLSKNTIMTVVMMNMIGVWNEFVFANTFISKPEMKTLPVGIFDFVGEKGAVDSGATFAAISLCITTLLILYFILNKRIIEGMIAGAIKE